MDAQEKYEYWLDIAQYDLITAEAMLNSKRWLYVVFMCQQAIEKLVKGLYVLYVDDDIPKTHNIRVLIERFENQLSEILSDDRREFLDELMLHYLNGRYTTYKQKLSESLNEQTAIYYYQQTEAVFAWLLTMKP